MIRVSWPTTDGTETLTCEACGASVALRRADPRRAGWVMLHLARECAAETA